MHIKLLKNAALGLAKNYKNDSKRAKEATMSFQIKIAENFNGADFAVFIKYLEELKRNTIGRKEANNL